MIGIILKLCVLITFMCIKNISTECNGEDSEEHDQDNVSLNSDSYEPFNISSKENRIDSEDISEMENETIAIHNGNEIINDVEWKVAKPSLKSAKIPKDTKIRKEANKTNDKRYQINYPFSVSIQKKSSHYTSGALVDKQWVLTSAREFYNVRESIKMFRVRLGSVNCKKGGIIVPIKQVEVHPSYVQNGPGFDIALIKLEVPMEHDQFLEPIAISQVRGRVVSAKFLATYWPRLIVKGNVLPASAKERIKNNSMRVSTQKLIPWDQCRKIMEYNNVTLEPSSHCLEPIESHHSPCMPDPGAPVLARDGLWGITSSWTAKRCPDVVSATVFTRLSAPRVHSWLQLILVDL